MAEILTPNLKASDAVMKTTTYGTAYFVTQAAAVRYYSAYEDDPRRAVETKLDEGSIHIGKPELKPGQTLSVIDEGTRYAITESIPYQPKTGEPCGCRRGMERDNCPQCEGTVTNERITNPMKAQHTAGEWFDNHPSHASFVFTTEKAAFPIAECHGPDRQANARLIAAAPDLLEAARRLLPYLPPEGTSLDHAEVRNLRAAVAKATAQAGGE